MAGKHGKAKRRMQNMVSADVLVLLLSQKVILVCLSSRGMIYAFSLSPILSTKFADQVLVSYPIHNHQCSILLGIGSNCFRATSLR